ncbi:hypothetical protein [Sinosporangium siamense]|uniref:Uncharacterized protein n=1 Tax=Sinosporangium siamense TaxID=1367973 RepID=A0A919VCJ1_9ACTN|nr:hypothetical protein [Sinosporangium siamense]GII93184.1 hypothetical protein Ssi02_34150 [Sinosporangium siamense]
MWWEMLFRVTAGVWLAGCLVWVVLTVGDGGGWGGGRDYGGDFGDGGGCGADE